VEAVEEEERGVLPMPWAGRAVAVEDGILRAGWRGGWFHPATGYSLPVAARLAEAVAGSDPEAVRAGALRPLLRRHRRQRRYAHLLNRMLFRWYPPRARRNIFERFYRLPEETIARFYALDLRTVDRLRLVVGRPPAGLSLRRPVAAGGAP
jgi:lycopene beta-cyclase